MDAYKCFIKLKMKYPDCIVIIRQSDSFVTFLNDAIVLAFAIGSVLTQKNKVTSTSFCCNSLELSLAKLVRSGHRVAVCENLG